MVFYDDIPLSTVFKYAKQTKQAGCLNSHTFCYLHVSTLANAQLLISAGLQKVF